LKDKIIATNQCPTGKSEFRRIINLGTKLLDLKIEHRKNEILISAKEEMWKKEELDPNERKYVEGIQEILIIPE
jgi:hypothetical protein